MTTIVRLHISKFINAFGPSSPNTNQQTVEKQMELSYASSVDIAKVTRNWIFITMRSSKQGWCGNHKLLTVISQPVTIFCSQTAKGASGAAKIVLWLICPVDDSWWKNLNTRWNRSIQQDVVALLKTTLLISSVNETVKIRWYYCKLASGNGHS